MPLYHLLHGIAGGGRHSLHVLGVEFLTLTCLPTTLQYKHFVKFVVTVHLDEKSLCAFGFAEHTYLLLITHHGEPNHHTVGGVKFHTELSLEVSKSHTTLLHHGYRGELKGIVVFIAHLAPKGEALRENILDAYG